MIAPLTQAEFFTHFREQTVAFVRTSEAHRFETLLNWDDLNHLLYSGVYSLEELQVRESMPVPTSVYTNQGRLNPYAFSSLMDRGASLLFNRLHKYVPRLLGLCLKLAEQTGEEVTAKATVTSGKDDAWECTNTENICVLQIAGSKRWQLCRPRDAAKSIPPAPQRVPFFDEVLNEGDFLFVPAKCLRRCENGPGRSLDVHIVLEPPCGRDVVNWLTNRLTTDETFNWPLTRVADPSALASHEAALKARLIEQVQAWSLTGFLVDRAATRSKEAVIRIQGTQNEGPRA
ncbi:MAG: cupin domain-containing protein [Xanthobacteraceae bacterium]